MFETAEIGRSVTKREFVAALPQLRTDLLRVQNELVGGPSFSVVIVIGGVDGAGKGDTVNTLHEWMDPRFLEAHAFGPASDEEAERPDMWRFWRVLPPKGRIGIFFGSWYTKPILERAYGKSDDDGLDRALVHINNFEQALVDDGTLVLKYWFHLSKKAQKRRLKALAAKRKTAWRVTEQDWQHFALYDTFVPICERALRETSTGEAPWTIVEGAERNYRELTVGRHLLGAIRAQLERRRAAAAAPAAPVPEPGPPRGRSSGKPKPGRENTILSTLDLTQRLTPKRYKREVLELQGRLNLLSRKAKARGVTTVLVFEGADAAGKGGAIRRITRALDARSYKVVPIAAPNDEERARHYLWRFWRHLPRAGQFAIFDRSWYGRVLVERVEGFAAPHEWQRAYHELNEFEEALTEAGVGLAKLWLHIDPDEQLARFQAREKTSYKQFKITREDYRNRERWELYEEAVHELVERTSTDFAPWTLVEANDKYFARVKVLRRVVETLEQALAREKRRRREAKR